MDCPWFGNYVSSALRTVWDDYMAILEGSKETELLGTPTIELVVEESED